MSQNVKLGYQKSKALVFALCATLKVGIAVAILNEKSKQFSALLSLLELVESVFTDFMMFFTAFTAFFPANPVDSPPVTVSTKSSIRSSRISTASTSSEYLWHRTAIKIPMEQFLAVDDAQLDADSVKGRAAGMQMLEHRTAHTLCQRTTKFRKEDGPEAATMFDRSDEPDNAQIPQHY
ncbi:hypothetical protein TWF694_004739 [Orbilia ellipsospora]|uniref:Uncharacterized protein n=1 Tax=Orbilia ellipsospora TaxID=2528407 RepID=A0AAV9X266_9PEZI